MWILKFAYKKFVGKDAPYYYDYSLITIITKPIRKFFTNVIIANCPFNNLRVILYRFCGFKIGKNTFIGMKCYLDDMCYDSIKIGDNVVISYGVYFACHGKNQNHLPIIIEDGAYIGMRSSIISNNADHSENGVIIGRESVVGACSLVNRNVPPGCTCAGIPIKIIKFK